MSNTYMVVWRMEITAWCRSQSAACCNPQNPNHSISQGDSP